MEKGKWNKLRAFLTDYRTVLGLWLIVGVVAALCKLPADRHNNFNIYMGVFRHAIDGLCLYGEYPAEYGDSNYYGPLFALLAAPFALLPTWAGMVLWCVSLSMLLYVAIRRSTLSDHAQVFILWFCAHELLTALFMQQFNVAIAAILVFAFAMVEREKDHWATLAIVVGMLVKLYGVVGLAFFFFSKHKGRYIASFVGWTLLLFALPMLFTSPAYIVGQYQEWALALGGKGDANLLTLMQNISLLGFVRKVGYACAFGMPALRDVLHGISAPESCLWTNYSDLWVIAPGLLLFALPYLRFRQWENASFRAMFLASVLMFVCLFSTGTESSGYIVALVGVVIWYACVPWKRNGWDLALLIFCFILTSMSPSDLFPPVVRREWIIPLSLKALPVIIIWLQLCVEMLIKDYKSNEI